jgi:hypothetical protein
MVSLAAINPPLVLGKKYTHSVAAFGWPQEAARSNRHNPAS